MGNILLTQRIWTTNGGGQLSLLSPGCTIVRFISTFTNNAPNLMHCIVLVLTEIWNSVSRTWCSAFHLVIWAGWPDRNLQFSTTIHEFNFEIILVKIRSEWIEPWPRFSHIADLEVEFLDSNLQLANSADCFYNLISDFNTESFWFLSGRKLHGTIRKVTIKFKKNKHTDCLM